MQVIGGLVTHSGHYLTAINGGGFGGTDHGPSVVPLHTDAVEAAGWETFRIVFIDDRHEKFALQTMNGNFITADHGGGIGGPNDSTCPIHTDSTVFGAWETLTFTINADASTPTMTIQTFYHNYITAVGGGGIVKHSTYPIQSNRTRANHWEHFSIHPLGADKNTKKLRLLTD